MAGVLILVDKNKNIYTASITKSEEKIKNGQKVICVSHNNVWNAFQKYALPDAHSNINLELGMGWFIGGKKSCIKSVIKTLNKQYKYRCRKRYHNLLKSFRLYREDVNCDFFKNAYISEYFINTVLTI